MTRDELLAELKRILKDRDGDQEMDHVHADKALLKFIDDPYITAAFDAIPKWYA